MVCDIMTFPLCCSCGSSFQESLLRMLLGIEMLQVTLRAQTHLLLCTYVLYLPHMLIFFFSLLQTSIINVLLEKLPEFMLDRSVTGRSSLFKS